MTVWLLFPQAITALSPMSATVSTAAELSGDERWCTVSSMTEPLRLTIVYEDAGDGWVTARVAEVPGAISEGASRADAKENVIDALRGILELRFGEHALSEPIEDSESLELVIAA